MRGEGAMSSLSLMLMARPLAAPWTAYRGSRPPHACRAQKWRDLERPSRQL
jgi:hypothetical protein